MEEKILQLIAEAVPEAVALRHELHRTPEIAGEEHRTSDRLRHYLAGLGVELHPPYIGTDVVGLIRGAKAGPNFTLRADIDALPIGEKEREPWCSTLPGMMHACGHDGHMAILCGAAKVLAALRNDLAGSVRCVFQPGEEVRALGKELVEAGVLDDPPADFALALHGWPDLPLGTVAGRAGTNMAAAGFISVCYTGKGGHGSRPELAVNPITAMGELATLLPGIPAAVATRERTVVTVCTFEAGSSSNVIPDSAYIEGTTRFLNRADGELLKAEFERLAAEVASRRGVAAETVFTTPYPPTVSAPEAVRLIEREVVPAIPGLTWRTEAAASMSAEDFSYYLEKVPGAYLFLGLGGGAGLHSPDFAFNDAAIPFGIAVMVFTALRICR